MDEINHSLRTHSKFSPSSLECRETCAGWESDNKDSIYADAGEKCHEAIEAKLRGDDTLQRALTEDLAYSVEEAYSYVAPRVAGAERLISEQRLYHAHPLLRELAHGTPDLLAITGSVAQLVDFKFGRRPVTNAQTNLQGWTYAVALWDNYPEVEEITIHFIAPRVADGTSSATFTRTKDYDRMLTRVLRVVERANLPPSEREKLLRASWEACAYCSVKGTCKKLTSCMDFINYDADDTLFSVQKLQETAKREDKDSLRYQYEFARVAQDWAVQKLEQIKQKALEGNEIDGYELRFTKGRTTVHPIETVLAAGVDLPIDKILKSATIPLTELKRLYSEGVDASEKSEKEKELMTKLASGGALKQGEETCYLYRTNEKQ